MNRAEAQLAGVYGASSSFSNASSRRLRGKKGGHFAAWEQPQLFSEEVRAGLRSLRG
jgi:pimeloyl-ACP methyl ester carboxylesterase